MSSNPQYEAIFPKTNDYGLSVNSGSTTNLTFDLNGNMLSDGMNSYAWDAENRMIKITYPGSNNFSTFVYDGRGRNISIVETVAGIVTSTKQFVWFNSERQETRNTAGTITAQFFARGERISGTDYFWSKDCLGSVTELANSSGAVQAQYTFEPYGRSTKLQGSLNSDFSYAGYYVHGASGLFLTAVRAYNPAIGRFVNRDLLAENGGTNLFGYAFNDPVNLRDPSGLRSIEGALDQTFGGGGQWYENWGGGNWANGHQSPSTTTNNFPNQPGERGYVPPVNAQDYCYYLHDICQHNASLEPIGNRRRCFRKNCDRSLATCLTSAGGPWWESAGWNGHLPGQLGTPNGAPFTPNPYAPGIDYYTPAPPDPNWNWNPPTPFMPPPPNIP